MKPQAIIFDVYHTLLQVDPPPADAEAQWRQLLQSYGVPDPAPGLDAFARDCETAIAREHAWARARGLEHPEIYWPAIVRETWPILNVIRDQAWDDFLYAHAQLQRRVQLSPGAAPVLDRLTRAARLLGIASNAQPYTRRELATALRQAGLPMTVFTPDLCQWSFRLGFSKPNPHFFRPLTLRLLAQGVRPEQILMVGDRLDNDLEPARAQGWRTWHLPRPGEPPVSPGGDWHALNAIL